MLRDPIHHWLLRLCDPEGATALPAQRLRKSQFIKLLVLATEHGVAGAVLANLTRLFAGEGYERLLLPNVVHQNRETLDAHIAQARRKWFDFVATTLSLRQRTIELLAAFQVAGVPAAVIKGEDFADRLYQTAGLRPFRDIDLMLPRPAMDIADKLMRRFRCREVASDLKSDSSYGERAWETVDLPSTSIELHWNLINSPSQRRHSSITFEDLQFTEVQQGDRVLLKAQPAAMLLIACVHAVIGHRFDRLQQLCDIRQLCRGAAGPIDYSSFRQLAAQTRTSEAVQGALAVTARILDDLACTNTLGQLHLPCRNIAWRLLVSDATLLVPYSPVNTVRRTIVREWMKRAA